MSTSRQNNPILKNKLMKILLLIGCFSLVSMSCALSKDEITDTINNFLVGISEPDEPPPGNDQPAGVQGAPGDPNSNSMPPVAPGGSGNSLPLKPVAFRNLGTVPYTVSPWTYTPPDPSSLSIPSAASTVVIPGGNTSSSLSLPLGTYTWCYWWESGDINQDGMIEYAHALDERPVTLDQSDSDDIALAETVDLEAPVTTGILFGLCGLDFSPYVVDQLHADSIRGALIGLAHDTDYITLRGPITLSYWFVHSVSTDPSTNIGAGTPTETTIPEIVVLAAGETRKFELVERREDHPGDWNMYIWLISVDG